MIKHYDTKFKILEPFNIVSLMILIISFFIINSQLSRLSAFVTSFLLIGALVDLSINIVIGNIWSRKSLKDVGETNVELLKNLRMMSWQPRIVGILERIIFTTSFIFGAYEIVGFWLVLKVIGSWNKDSEQYQKKSNKKPNTKLWRTRENIFLIGTALSIIFSFVGAQTFKYMNSRSSHFMDNSKYQHRILHNHIIK